MKENNVISFEDPAKSIVEDTLTDFLRESAQKMLHVAIESEVNDFIATYSEVRLANGHQRVVRNGYLPARDIQTGIGQVNVKVPRVRDRENDDDKIIFKSNLIPNYMRRTATLDVMLPLMYLKGISTSDFSSVLEPMLGENAKAISPNVINRLKQDWHDEYEEWKKRDLSKKRYVYLWADGIYLRARMEDAKSCVLVIIGADENGNKELVAMIDGFRESACSWKTLLNDLKRRGLTDAPKLAVGDGALGFWSALADVYPETKHQRCWVHKSANVIDKLPKSQQEKSKSMIKDIYMAETKADALIAWDDFVSNYHLKYPKAVECLQKEKDIMLTFYDFPAEHWVHLRTSNPIESTFATVRHRTKKSKNCFSRETIIASVFKLCLEAEKRWRKLNGSTKRLAQVVNLDKFIDGIHESEVGKKEEVKQKTVAA